MPVISGLTGSSSNFQFSDPSFEPTRNSPKAKRRFSRRISRDGESEVPSRPRRESKHTDSS